MKTKTALLLFIALLIIYTLAGCKKKDPTPTPVPVPYTQFKINSNTITYYNWNYFGKDICAYSTYCGGFYYYETRMESTALR